MARPRSVDGGFRYRHPIEIRYNDTDALGHVNNAVYFSYFEMARSGYYRAVVGHAFGTGPDAQRRSFVIAEAHISYRSPALYGEPLFCCARVGWVSRSAFSFEYRLEVEASDLGAARLIADGSTVQVFYDLERGRPMRTPADLVAELEAYEGRRFPARPAASGGALRPRSA
jgi:acyl-CoA thioester hydrolase